MKRKLSAQKIACAILFASAFIATAVLFQNRYNDYRSIIVQLITIIEAALCLAFLVPSKKPMASVPKSIRLSKSTIAALLIALTVVPLTVYAGIRLFNDRKYYFISLLIIVEIFLPYVYAFEKRRPKARELVLVASICAIAVAGRAAFNALPQFKPVIAVVIISGVCFGAETGFLTGAVSCFVSNFFFGQGPWTPWQMFAFGLIGFIAGVLFQKGVLRTSRVSLCVFGGLSTLVIFGGIMNLSYVLQWNSTPTPALIAASYSAGLPFDVIHAAATVFFLWFCSAPLIEKLDRVKTKYGIGAD